MPLPPGQILKDRYRIDAPLGQGGFGAVYRAWDANLERPLAIKENLDASPQAQRQFKREAQMLYDLSHPHLPRVIDHFIIPGQGQYLVMEFVEGQDLQEMLRRFGGPLPEAQVLAWSGQICDALVYLHSRTPPVIHRDIKPGNIRIRQDGGAMLVDFGIAKLYDPHLTTTVGARAVTPGYSPPEQYGAGATDARSDVYALGATLYHLLSGTRPPESVQLASGARLAPPEQLNPALSIGVAQAVLKAMQLLPEQRYPTIAEFWAALERCLKALGSVPGLEPAGPTRPLADQIQTGEPQAPPLTVGPQIEFTARQPEFLTTEKDSQAPLFVSRERQLGRLESFLDQALGGQGSLAFVTGGPGRGKSALLEAFSRQAMGAHLDLLVASGVCNQYSGVGDPYLPWREIMGMLSGDVEARWAAGTVSTAHARRLWAALPSLVKALLARGPHLIESFAPGEPLLERAALALPGQSETLRTLRERVARHGESAPSLEQSHIFEQFSNVLRAVADEHPLLLVLDDLQWADASSISLLFHLGRRLSGARILIVGAYRPEEVALERDGARHPLEKILSEIKRQYGDIWIDLARVEELEGRHFVDALLDSEPNRLGQDFRQALYRRTGGQPLFTIELLRAMQARGDMQQDESGRWAVGPKLDWDSLPARVEAVIEERIARLEDKLHEVLTVASVEGEDFIAQVLAHVQGTSDRDMLRMLSGELEKRHRLVREREGFMIGERTLARFDFSHVLYQQYLYNELGEGERLLLHREIGHVLEELYAGQNEEIAEQLARHYAGVPAKERHYSRLAGDRAVARFANVEALRYYNRGLELTSVEDYAERFLLLLRREAIYDLIGEREAQEEDLVELRRLSTDFPAALEDQTMAGYQAQVKARWAKFASQTDYQGAVQLAEEAAAQATAADRLDVAVEAYYIWSNTLSVQGEYQRAISTAEAGIAIAREIADQRQESRLLNILGLVALDLKDPSSAREYFERSLAISQEIHDPHLEAQPLTNLGNAAGLEGDYQAAQDYYQQALKTFREVGDRRQEGVVLGNLAWIASMLGDFEMAQSYFEEQRPILVEIGERWLEAFALINLSGLALARGEPAEGLAYAEQGLALSREIGSRPGEAYSLTFLGHSQVEIGDLEAAERAFQEALDVRISLNQPNLATEPQAGLAQVALARQDIPTAMSHVERILAFLDSGGSLEGAEEPLRVYLTCYQVLREKSDPRAQTILEMAHEMLMVRADGIHDADMRRRFLENIPHHCQIVAAWEAFKANG